MLHYLRKLKQRKMLLALICVGIYPAVILSYVWYQSLNTGMRLRGAENGPLDAYRHTLASALVAYTSSPALVEVYTSIIEFNNSPANLMDRHNNHVGVTIEWRVHKLSEIKPAVDEAVRYGGTNSYHSSEVTWMPRELWED